MKQNMYLGIKLDKGKYDDGFIWILVYVNVNVINHKILENI